MGKTLHATALLLPLLVLCLSWFGASPACADHSDVSDSNLVVPLLRNVALTAWPTLGCTATVRKFIGKGMTQGMDCQLTTAGSPKLNVQFRQSNAEAGPYALWSNPSASGVGVTNNITFTAKIDGTPVALAPSANIDALITNMDSSMVTVNRLDLLNQ